MRVLIIYATEEGQTEKIAKHIADGLSKLNIPADRHNIADDSIVPVALDAYDGVIVGSPMHYSHYDSRLADCLRQYQQALKDIPSAFFSVSLGVLSHKEFERAEIEQIANAYLHDTGWCPEIRRHFAGALVYSKYNWMKRHMMHWIANKSGANTDMRCDYEFTDWSQVDEFVQEFAEFIQSCREPDEVHAHRSIFSQPSRQYSLKHRQSDRTFPVSM